MLLILNFILMFGIYKVFAVPISITTVDNTDDNKMLLEHSAFPKTEKILIFEVKACKDAHLVLCPKEMKQPPLYHIAIAGWSNTKTILARERDSYEFVDELLEIGVLDCNNYRPFWLTWEGGKIRFGRGLQVDIDMILSYDEPCPFAVHNIELSADQGVTVEWKIYPSESPPITPAGRTNTKVYIHLDKCPLFHVFQSIRADSRTGCAVKCVATSGCHAFNFDDISNSCELVSDTAESNTFTVTYYKESS